MAGNKAGNIKGRNTIYKKYGPDFYRDIGRKGGKKGHTGGFASMDKERLREYARKGGATSRRGPSKKNKEVNNAEI